MKKLIFIIFLFLIGCSSFQKDLEEKCCDVTFSKFSYTEDLDKINAIVTITVFNHHDYDVFIDAVDLYLYYNSLKLDRIFKNLKDEEGVIFGKSKKNFRFKITFPNNKNVENLIWGGRQSEFLTLHGLIYYNLPFEDVNCIVSISRKR